MFVRSQNMPVLSGARMETRTWLKNRTCQRKAARWIENKWKYTESPTSMISDLGLTTLESRRKAACIGIKMLFDIINRNKYVSESTIPKRQRCRNIRFQPIHAALMSYQNSFFPATIHFWNKLPLNIINSANLSDFRHELSMFYSSWNFSDLLNQCNI